VTRVAIPGSRFHPSTYFYLRDRSWIAGRGAKGVEAITVRTRRRSRPMVGPHRRLQMINIAGSGAPKMARGRVRGPRPGKHNGHRPQDDGPGNHCLHPVGHRWTIGRRRGQDGRVKQRAAAGWLNKTRETRMGFFMD